MLAARVARVTSVPDLEALERRGSEVAAEIMVLNQAMPPNGQRAANERLREPVARPDG